MWACVYMKTNLQDLGKRFVQVYYSLYALKIVHSRREFCAAIGMQPQNFRAVEAGRQGVSLPMLCNTINAYGIRPDWLFLGDGNMLSDYGDTTV